MSERRARRADEEPVIVARHGRLNRPGIVVGLLKLAVASVAVLLVSTLTVAAVAVAQLQSNIDSVSLVGEEEGPPPSLGSFEGGFNVLLVGSDECEYDYCPGREGVRNDVNILLHVSQDQNNITAVSLPRDLIVPIPSCPRANGEGNYSAMSARPLNESMSYGGLPCTVLTISKLTGLEIPFAGTITFEGVVQMSNAIGGVEVCTNGPVVDRLADNINLPKAGTYTLQGWEALGFLRTRKAVGDGSDLGRISNQQVFMSSLVRKVQSEGMLGDPAALYRIATVATQSMTLSNSLKNANTMISMAQVLKDVDLDRVQFVQYPTFYGSGALANKVVPDSARADKLFAKILADEPFTLAEDSVGVGAVTDPNAPAPAPETTPTPGATDAPPADTAPEVLEGIEGQSAGDYTCSNSN